MSEKHWKAGANCLYIFIDEAGEFNFAPKGSRYFVLTALSTLDVGPCVTELYDLKHRLIAEGKAVEYFHASEDRQTTRDCVFAILGDCAHIRVDAVIADKPWVDPSSRGPEAFYTHLFRTLMRYVLRQQRAWAPERIVVFTDTLPVRRKQEAILKGLKESIRREIGQTPFAIFSHQSRSHPYLQLVDYCGWAIYVKWERGEERPFESIKHLVGGEFEIFALPGKVAHYEIFR